MGGIYVDFSVVNQLNSPALNSNTFANRPAAGQIGRLFVSTDTFEIYRDNGTTWDLIGGPGTSTITGTGAATQVAYFNAAQSITGSNGLWFNPTNDHLGIGINTPGGLIHADGGANVARMILDANNNVARIFSFRTDNSQRFAFRVDGNETGNNAGADFQLRRYDDAGNFIDASLIVNRATGKKTFNATQNYVSGLASGNTIAYYLNVPSGTTFTTPNSISPLLASLVLNLAGNATIPNGSRTGADFYNTVNFNGAGTLTMSQAATIRALSNLKVGWAYSGSAVGTITHNSGINILFPDNSGQPLNITNNYALLINRQDANTGTITYTNRWAIYQEGSADLNYFNGNVLIGSTFDNGKKFQLTGNGSVSGAFSINTEPTNVAWNFSANGTNRYSVIATADTQGGLLIQRETNTQIGGIYSASLTQNGGSFSALAVNSSAELVFATNNVERARITNGASRMLIFKTTDAGQILQVNGNIAYTNTILDGGQVNVSTSFVDLPSTYNSIYGMLILVGGADFGAGAYFSDLVFYNYQTFQVISTLTAFGSPSARTYNKVSGGFLQLRMASGTYTVKVSRMSQD